MRSILILSFSVKGFYLGNKLSSYFAHKDIVDELTGCSHLMKSPHYTNIKNFLNENFHKYDCIIFISSCGLAIRHIADLIKSKTEDPAVVVVDDSNRFCISLLSGHIGGANDFSKEISSYMGCTSVITTASDNGGYFALDVFALSNNLANFDYKKAAFLESKVINETGLNIYLDEEYEISDKKGFSIVSSEKEADVLISIHDYSRMVSRTRQLWLIPRKLVLGIGCRRGTSKADLYNAIDYVLNNFHLPMKAISCITSIDLKRKEKGILELCDMLGVNFFTYSADELKNVSGSFSGSSFVEKITGVDNVCERSAMLKTKNKLLFSKIIYNKMSDSNFRYKDKKLFAKQQYR